MSPILPDLVDEGERLLALAHDQDATFALLGGVAVRLHAPEVPDALDRPYKDLDFAVPKGRSGVAGKLLADAGYEPEVVFNAMNSKERLLFHDTVNGRQVDVFVGAFRMCHEIPLSDRLKPRERTVPLAELLLTKLQIVQLNEKDIRDTVLLLHGHEVADHDDEAVNGARVAELCAADWGLWRTITRNLERCAVEVDQYALAEDRRSQIRDRLTQLLHRIEAAPKSRAWKLRDRIGERKRWYDLPEEVEQ
ncbi:MAG: nucleotidyltransferase family protein [Acidobacteriota bacterium]|nr:nucleotidyltransferase family protein [Acidobacteriota bacterium]